LEDLADLINGEQPQDDVAQPTAPTDPSPQEEQAPPQEPEEDMPQAPIEQPSPIETSKNEPGVVEQPSPPEQPTKKTIKPSTKAKDPL